MHLKIIKIDNKQQKKQSNMILWPFLAAKLKNCPFLIIFKQKLTSIDVKMRVLSKNIHPMHSKTIEIDKNHHKNHKKVVLCKFKGSKSDILCKNGQK